MDGEPTGTRVPGYTLLHQFRVSDGYLLVTDHDCPYEEVTVFTLLDDELRIVSTRSVAWMYNTFLLTRLEWSGERRLVAWFGDDFPMEVIIRPWGIPLVRPRLGLRRIRPAAAAARDSPGAQGRWTAAARAGWPARRSGAASARA